jgi:hypothetical protein
MAAERLFPLRTGADSRWGLNPTEEAVVAKKTIMESITDLVMGDPAPPAVPTKKKATKTKKKAAKKTKAKSIKKTKTKAKKTKAKKAKKKKR